MLSLNVHQRYFLFNGIADMRKSFDGLSGLIRNESKKDPLNGDIFIFVNKRRTQIRLLYWERDGFALYCKKLERGSFELPSDLTSPYVSMEVLSCLLQGLSLGSIKKRKRYDRPIAHLGVQGM